MELRLLRHATLVLRYAGRQILIDPMLSPAGTMEPVKNSPNPRANPLVPLPADMPEPGELDAVVVTHTHRDHFDDAAAHLLPKEIPLFCQPVDEEKLRRAGFERVRPVEASLAWEGITLHRTRGQHGTGQLGREMGPVSGFVFQAAGEPTLYVAGDTIWCREVADALNLYQPGVIVVNAGAARFLTGSPITMTGDDVASVCAHAPDALVVAVHMEAFNHCLLTRAELAADMKRRGLTEQVRIPADGELLTL